MSAATPTTVSTANVILLRLRFAIAIWPGLLLAVTTACSPEQTALSDAATATPRSSFTATVQCEQEVVPPQITEVRPAQAIPGSEISVIGSGGYVQDTCGGYSEGSKTFKLYLDNEPIGDLSCYINRCEKQLTLSSAISSGSHCLSVQKDECQFEIQVTTN
jgi:hypothetical protein